MDKDNEDCLLPNLLTFKASAVHLMPENIHTKGGERE
jgi:hypothetical protein